VAEVTVASLFFPDAAGATFELYQRKGVKPLQDSVKKDMSERNVRKTTKSRICALRLVLRHSVAGCRELALGPRLLRKIADLIRQILAREHLLGATEPVASISTRMRKLSPLLNCRP